MSDVESMAQCPQAVLMQSWEHIERREWQEHPQLQHLQKRPRKRLHKIGWPFESTLQTTQ